MDAAQINSYGDNSVIEIKPNTPKPTLKKGQILVENYAASINAIDWKMRSGYIPNLTFPITLGGDFAGKVVEVAEGLTDFKVGDEVYGQAIILNGGSGSMAELVAANITNTALKPKTINFEEAGALALAGVSAMQGLLEHIKLQKDQRILIHGGAGGIGHIAVQIAKSVGAYVATTVKAADVDFVKSLGADQVINYETEKFEEILKDFDVVFDNVGGEVAEKSFQVVKKGGIVVSMVGEPSQELAQEYEVTTIGQFTKTDTEHLNQLAELADSGKFKVHVNRIFTLDQTKKAFEYADNERPQGKVGIKIKD